MRALLLLSLLLTPCVSTAGTIFIDFELSGSTLHFFGGLLEIPPDGSLSGVMTVALPGTGPTSAAAGPAEITDLTLTADFAKTEFGATLSGTVGLTQIGAAAGTFAGDLTSLDVPMLSAGITAHIECSGATCSLFGTFPMDQDDTGSFANTSLVLADLIQPGMTSLLGTIESAPGQSLIDLVGKETSRHYVVPEPATGTLALLGLAVLAGQSRRGRATR